MLRSSQCRVLYAMSLAFLPVTTTVATADTIRMHSKGEALPFEHQGPFVTTSDGGVLAVGRSNAFISRDEGQSWKSFPLFQANDKYEARDERALLKLRDGTIVFAWMNERGRQQGGPWGKGGEAEAAKWVRPVCVIPRAEESVAGTLKGVFEPPIICGERARPRCRQTKY